MCSNDEYVEINSSIMLLSFLRISILSNVIRHLISYNPPKSIPLIKNPKRFFIKCNVDIFCMIFHLWMNLLSFWTGIWTFVSVRYFYENKTYISIKKRSDIASNSPEVAPANGEASPLMENSRSRKMFTLQWINRFTATACLVLLVYFVSTFIYPKDCIEFRYNR